MSGEGVVCINGYEGEVLVAVGELEKNTREVVYEISVHDQMRWWAKNQDLAS